MKIIYTDQCYESLDESQHFLIEEQGWSLKKVIELRTKLLDKADDLETTYSHYQEEEYLKHLKKRHRRVIVGYFKIIYRVEGDRIYITDFFDSSKIL